MFFVNTGGYGPGSQGRGLAGPASCGLEDEAQRPDVCGSSSGLVLESRVCRNQAQVHLFTPMIILWSPVVPSPKRDSLPERSPHGVEAPAEMSPVFIQGPVVRFCLILF